MAAKWNKNGSVAILTGAYMWISGIELRSLGCGASGFTCEPFVCPFLKNYLCLLVVV